MHNPTNDLNITYIYPDISTWRSGLYFGDASGGEFASYPSIRRVGCGLGVIDEEGNLVFGARFNLPGEIQTVPRGNFLLSSC